MTECIKTQLSKFYITLNITKSIYNITLKEWEESFVHSLHMMNLLNNKQITKTAKHHTASNKKEIFQEKVCINNHSHLSR